MENDELGQMTSFDANLNDDVSVLRNEVQKLLQREQALQQKHAEQEREFGQKRARFKDMFMKKEEELQQVRLALASSEESRQELHHKLENLEQEVNDVRTTAAITEASREDEVHEIMKKHQEEVASLHSIMKDAVSQAAGDTAAKYEQERQRLVKANEQMEQELKELHSKLSQEREGFLASVAKSLKKVGAVPQLQTQSEAENLEESMKKAQEDAEVLKSVVLPLEEEINMLKSKLRDAQDSNQRLEAQLHPEGVEEKKLSASEVDEKFKELSKTLEVEKASRTDLEMYVAVLNTQKNVLQEDADKLRSQLHEVCRLLEIEKREHTELKRTWQMANDQFLESQRLMMMDMRRMESVLSSEQQRQISELKKKDAEREAQEKRVQALEEQRLQQEQRKALQDAENRDASHSPSPSLDLIGTLDPMKKAPSKSSLTSDDLKFDTDSVNLETSGNLLDLGDSQEIRSLGDGDISRSTPDRQLSVGLTEAQQRAITAPTAEVEASSSLVAQAKASAENLSLVGKRLVSEKEWQMLQHELRSAREKLGKPCDMCNNYESQLQAAQESEKKSAAQSRTLERQLQAERQAAAAQKQYCQELEENLKGVAEEALQQLSTVTTKLEESEKYTQELRQQFVQSQASLQDQLKTLTENREEVQKELTRLQEENESLVGKHSKHAQQMQEESIDLPNNLEEMQLLLLRYREDIISAKVAKEHVEENLRSEILFLKAQVMSEQQEKATLEETLTQEITHLQEQLALLQSVKSELEHQHELKTDAEGKLKETEGTLKSIQAKSKQLISGLQGQVETHSKARTELENEVASLRAKIQSLQIDLDNSEAVQRDFVKLSQSLQIQLEKIRAAEHEVRWQHEEDVEDCNNCRQAFSVTRRKHHCKHCGKIFCSDCLTKNVNSGPHLRPSKVCDVCHTILVQDATPYFSTEPPITPD